MILKEAILVYFRIVQTVTMLVFKLGTFHTPEQQWGENFPILLSKERPKQPLVPFILKSFLKQILFKLRQRLFP